MPAERVSNPVIHLIAGPNGAGKTTLATLVLQPVTQLPFVNADLIALERWPSAQAEHAYEASRAAADERARLISAGVSIISETVFSHPSKLALIDLAHRAGYRVELHAVLLPEEVTVARVDHRVRTGGHDVPETKIRERYHRLWPLVARAMAIADVAWIYDNSLAATPLRLVAHYEFGTPVGPPHWPLWTPKAVRS